jgi:hypothetical protein
MGAERGIPMRRSRESLLRKMSLERTQCKKKRDIDSKDDTVFW